MNFVFRGARGEIGRTVHFQEGDHDAMNGSSRNSRMFLITVLLLFLVLNSLQISHNFLMWLLLGVFLMATAIRMHITFQQMHAHAQANSTSSDLPPVVLAARGRRHVLRLQLALLDRDFTDSDSDALRALDADTDADAPSMTEEEINALPVHEYKIQTDDDSSPLHLRNSGGAEVADLTCSVCLEQVNAGELVRSLPCLHQFHVECIDRWLRQQGTCPVCKYCAASWWPGGGGSGRTGADPSRMV